MNLNIFMITLTFLVSILGCYAEDEKRILLTDPQYSHGIEATLQTLTSRIDHLETQHQADFSRLETHHQADISQLKGSLSQCQVDISQIESQHQVNISRLETQHQADLLQIKGSLSQCQADNQLLKSDYQELKIQLQ